MLHSNISCCRRWISNILIPACVQFLPCSCSYHEVTSDIWLEDFIKGAPREWAVVKVEDLRRVVQAVVIMSTALYYQRGLGVVGGGFVLFSTGRVEYPVQSYVLNMAGRIAGVSDGRRVTLRLRDRKRNYKLVTCALRCFSSAIAIQWKTFLTPNPDWCQTLNQL